MEENRQPKTDTHKCSKMIFNENVKGNTMEKKSNAFKRNAF
jgi:hypothetical protein